MKVVRSNVLIVKLDTSFFSILIAMCMIWSMYYFVINNLETYVLYAFVIIFCFWNMWSVFGGHSLLLHVYCELTIFFQTKKNFHLNAKNFTWKEDSFQLMEDDTNRLDVLLSASRWHGVESGNGLCILFDYKTGQPLINCWFGCRWFWNLGVPPK